MATARRGYAERQWSPIVESSWTWEYASGPDRNGYDMGLTYDRNSIIVWAEDRWHSGRDAERGVRSGASVPPGAPDRVPPVRGALTARLVR